MASFRIRLGLFVLLLGMVLFGSVPVQAQEEDGESLPTIAEKTEGMVKMDGIPDEEDPMLEMALARIRQLSAHEVGHTLGLAHNFAASVNDRASVMDYPAPLARVQGDSITLDEAYDTGVGRWDEMVIRYAYAQPAPNQTEAELLDDILQEAEDRGLLYVTDADARPAEAAHPKSNLWDNGRTMVRALDREMNVRDVLLDRAGSAELAPDVQARMEQHLRGLHDWLDDHPGPTPEAEAHRTAVRTTLERFLNRTRETTTRPAALDTPPGSPIGQGPAYQRRHAQRQIWLEQWASTPYRCTLRRP